MPVPEASSGQAAPRQLIRDRAYAAIKTAILDGTLVPGERLDDADLQSWLQMSRTPVRQALYALTLEGLVETAPQSHTRVVRPRPENAVENLQTIGVLVVGVVALAVPAMTEADRRRLAELAAATAEQLRSRDLAAALRASGEYYRLLTSLCPNRPLVHLVEQASPSLGYYVSVAFQSIDLDWATYEAEYDRLVDALRAGSAHDIEQVTRRLFGLATGD
ncbi:MAG TPA: GntR family transcriptional regulator [Leifsonia sp.]